ncbi:hypothetical protein RJ639_043382 [Escallonia herrerae]|uniref:Filament-like plant protein 4 n=1 Tax=Escallonia herrerae TaxID=1293975 RepID=A0AA88WA04_9ASTE|nr:hypothetical protein RJ639_004796 [Escallonia herrerae]KAK3023766.1 hypothetical protein RJ639_043382 [Escallonia herrerae]
MDRRSWPWKKKSSDKAAIEKAIAGSESGGAHSVSAGSQSDQGKQVNYKKPNYVQISVESYSHLTGLEDQLKLYEDQVKLYEDQVKNLDDEVKELNEKLSEAHSEMSTKETLVKQHAKVAEEAVSGWEKAEAEALALKNHLESVTLLKLTAEDRASHLDGALKECMRQIRNLKEDHEQQLHDVALAKTKQFDKMKLELEAKISNLDQELLRSAAENAAISRSLQERSNMLIKMSEEKSQAEADIELLKSNIEACEREINSFKYELHVVTKELEIRNEEKNMSVRLAEAANKQHTDGIKKIAKLEAECQRLRGLVRKKLPGPAALAQMKLEVENLGRDYGETRLRKSPVKPSSPHLSPLPEFSLDTVHKYHKENELLTERLLAMEEETKMLKEALAKRNSELQASRNICAKTVSKLQSLELELHNNGQQKSTKKSGVQIPIEGSFSQSISHPPSLTSMSEDGNDDAVSCSGSWATALISEPSHFKTDKTFESPRNAEKANRLDLMDDFLEMEKLANLPNDSDSVVSSSDILNNTKSEVVNHDLVEITTGIDNQSKVQDQIPSQESSDVELLALSHPQADAYLLSFKVLQSRISVVFESISKDTELEKVLEDIRHIVQEMHDSLHLHSVSSDVKGTHSPGATCDGEAFAKDNEASLERDSSLVLDSEGLAETAPAFSQNLAAATSRIYDFVLLLGKEAKAVQAPSADEEGLSRKLEKFSGTFNDVINRKISLTDFILCLSHVLSEASELRFNVLGYKHNEQESSSPDCIDKIALPENKVVQDSSEERYPNGCAHFSDSTSDPDIPHEGSFVPTSESNASSRKCSLEEFEQLKLEKANLLVDLARCNETLESTKSQLLETEQVLAEVKSQLTSAQKLNGLADTQLKCMAESYNSLETRAEQLQTEVNLLQAKTESLDNELQEERRSHQDVLARFKVLQEELQRIESCAATDNDAKNNQEREIAAAAEKLAECQETIFLLGKQLKGMRPQTEFMGSPHSERSHKSEGFSEEEPTTSGTNLQDIDQAEMDNATSTNLQRAGSESPMDLYIAPFSPPYSEANTSLRSPDTSKDAKHRATKSGSSSSSTPTPEKHSRGFSRFFSTKAKNDH